MKISIVYTIKALLPLLIFLIDKRLFAQNIRFPDDAGVINIKEAPYFAKGDGETDDTQAISAALRDWNYNSIFGASATIYFPEGTYLVSNTIESIDAEGKAQCGVRIIGAGKNRTTIKLVDNASGFTNRGALKPVIRTNGLDGNRGNWGYSNYVQHLTVDIGAGNAGAIGIHYKVANWGSMSHVNILTSDPGKAGRYGILVNDISGAGLVEDVSIDGFEYGVYAQDVVNNIVFDGLNITNQTIAGIMNQNRNLAIYDLNSNNSVPAIIQNTNQAYLALVNANLNGGSSGNAAIENGSAFLFARNVRSEGYSLILNNTGDDLDISGGQDARIEEWVSHPVVSAWESSTKKSLNLPVKRAPEFYQDDLSKWVNVMDFGAVPNDGIDDTEAIQDAIDSGAETVYFPWGSYVVDGTVIVREKVRKIDFIWSKIEGDGEIILSNTEGPDITLENLFNNGIEIVHASSSDIVYRYVHNIADISNTPEGTGDLFITDMGPWGRVSLKYGIKAWIRQINREWISFNNDGCKVWIFGMNVEAKDRTVQPFTTTNGGVTEIIGGAIDPLNIQNAESRGSLFIVKDASLSVTCAGNERPNPSGFIELVVTEEREGETRKTYYSEFPTVGQRWVIPLYSAVNAEVLPVELTAFTAVKAEQQIRLEWATASELDNRHFEIERSADGKRFTYLLKEPGKGNNVAVQKYSAYDTAPFAGLNYYRLKQVDTDGSYTYSTIRAVNFDGEGMERVLYPNPVRGIATLSVQSGENMQRNLIITDAGGRIVQQRVLKLQKGENVVPMDLTSLVPGIYFLDIETGQSLKIIRQ